jgi:hypothetical protein
MKTDFEINPNSPETVLGQWLQLVSTDIASRTFVVNGMDVTTGVLLAIILEFADKNHKLFEMYEWLTSQEGNEFLRREEYQPAGNMVKSELFMFDNDLDDELELTKYQLNLKLRDYIEDYFIQFQHRPYLRTQN